MLHWHFQIKDITLSVLNNQRGIAMCGIVGAVAQRDVAPLLLEGLKRLEYRGYDSAGMAILDPSNEEIQRIRTKGKVCELAEALKTNLPGSIGIAHTRWATHGKPSESNAHPHISNNHFAIVHNGIIENHDLLRIPLLESGYSFSSETDTEVAAHMIHKFFMQEKLFLPAVLAAIKTFKGAFALGIMAKHEPHHLLAVRRGCPLVIGLGIRENFFASDPFALLPVAQRFIYLEEGDVADVHRDSIVIYDHLGKIVDRKIHTIHMQQDAIDRGKYRHYMLKEIFEQPQAVRDTMEGRFTEDHVLENAFGTSAHQLFDQIQRVQIVACGTSYHAGLIGRYWLESLAGVPCQVEIASENRYRHSVVESNALFVCISQSGETADTLASLRQAKNSGYLASLGICNVPESSLVRESNLIFMTRAGTEIGVASTKAFTTQLTALFMLTLILGRRHKLSAEDERNFVQQLCCLPTYIEQALALDDAIKQLARKFIDKQHALFLGRGLHFPIAMEGALKLKEISYIHAEAYPAGELKHGPLALVDKEMPVIAVAPNDELLEKLKSNLCEVQARGGELIIFADESANIQPSEQTHILQMPQVIKELAPVVYTIPLQLLAYHVAVLKGTDIDQPRNLAKSVTVE
jgi:glucosamine--fructose-6-phosphate aminotransferase (isomerizing)